MNQSKCTLCIRKEDKNKWEKRAPVIPSHAKEFKQTHGINICVQPSKIRIFKDSDYKKQGIELINDLSQCSLILALKEIPIELIMEARAYMFFTHTTKGQNQNMPMLKKFKQSRCTVIDYEKITDDEGRRLIFFGIQAGQSGMIETFHALGQRLSAQGLENPFIDIKQPYQYPNLKKAKEKIIQVGSFIKQNGLSDELVPLVCGFCGYGHTSKGAQEIFDLLPHQEIPAKDLKGFMDTEDHSNNQVYKVVFKEKDMVEPIDRTMKFELNDYYQNPHKYQSRFSQYLPYLTLIVNCIYWEPKYPRFVKNSDLRSVFSSHRNPRLKVIGDITCDIEGSVECTKFSTTPENPFFLFDPATEKISRDPQGKGLAVMSIDNLPAEIALESSLFFSKAIMPFLPKIALADFTKDFDQCHLPPPIKRAVILYNGEFTPEYKYMDKFI
ncbi:MAG: hypothetical protein GF421_12170 [Candidatus Aminicenantes bacterium]|nr:hypothetical protein [Candidatus Aminicenantes bacterium]